MKRFLPILVFLSLALSLLLFALAQNITAEDVSEQITKDIEPKSKHLTIESSVLQSKERQEQQAREQGARLEDVEKPIKVVLELDSYDRLQDRIDSIRIRAVGIEATHENKVQALVLPSKLDELAALPFVKLIREPLTPYPTIVSQGAAVIHSDIVNADGNTGQGVKLAVIDVGFDTTNPEISSNIVESKSFLTPEDITGGSNENKNHGTAVAEIITDVAPGAQLYLYNISTDIEFYAAVDYIIAQGQAKIISMSLGFTNAGPYDGTSGISQKITSARNGGILFIVAAGNYAERHWDGQFSDGDANSFNNFFGTDETIDVFAPAGSPIDIALSWDDIWGSSGNDYDLYVLNSRLTVILGRSESFQNGDDNPVERVSIIGHYTGAYHIVIKKFSATRAVNFDLFSQYVNLGEYNVPSSSITNGADAVGAFSVGAKNWSTGVLEPFSSQGPTNDGRIKPDISGPDGVTTSALNPFFGTSAAAPHVAGVAALAKAVSPAASAATLQSSLEQNTISFHPKSNQDGTGLVDAMFLLEFSPDMTETVTLSDSVLADAVFQDIAGELAVTVLTDKLSYQPGESMMLFGRVYRISPSNVGAFAPDSHVNILIVPGDGTTQSVRTVSGPDGSYTAFLDAPAAAGEYRIIVNAKHQVHGGQGPVLRASTVGAFTVL